MKEIVRVRESGVELLRIIAAMMVMISHLTGPILNSIDSHATSIAVRFLLSITVPAVDVFIIITGYFSWKTDKRTLGKPFSLVLMLVLFTVGSYILQLIMGLSSFSFNELVRYCFPFNYFVTLFIALYLVSPYINKCLRTLNESQWTRFIIIVISVFSIYPIAIDCVQESLGISLNGSSTISRLGSQNGYNVINFFLLYVIGAYISATGIDDKYHSKKKAIIIGVGCIFLIFLWSLIGKKYFPAYSNSAMSYHNPLVILLASSLFVFFKSIKFSNKVINRIAKAAFAAFLLHHHLFQFLFLQFHITLQWYAVLLWLIVCSFLLYFISWLVYEIYSICTNWLVSRLEKIEIPN